MQSEVGIPRLDLPGKGIPESPGSLLPLGGSFLRGALGEGVVLVNQRL
jgi:hypothetical protein